MSMQELLIDALGAALGAGISSISGGVGSDLAIGAICGIGVAEWGQYLGSHRKDSTLPTKHSVPIVACMAEVAAYCYAMDYMDPSEHSQTFLMKFSMIGAAIGGIGEVIWGNPEPLQPRNSMLTEAIAFVEEEIWPPRPLRAP